MTKGKGSYDPRISYVAVRLKEIRKKRGLSQKKLSHMCGFHYTWVSQIETGRRDPSLGSLVELCDALNVSADYLIGRSDDEHVY